MTTDEARHPFQESTHPSVKAFRTREYKHVSIEIYTGNSVVQFPSMSDKTKEDENKPQMLRIFFFETETTVC